MLLSLVNFLSFGIPGAQKFFSQRLDHFNPLDKRVFMQRYYENDQYSEKNKTKSIIIYVGGESELYSTSITKGSVIKLAEMTKSMIFGLEHRFFGVSHPFSYLNRTSYQYNTVRQALEDISSFILSKKSEFCMNSSCSVTIIGGSYPGSLSSWFRQQYPFLANFSWSSSAPIHIVNDFPAYDEHCRRVLESHCLQCYSNSKKILDKYHKGIETKNSSILNILYTEYGFHSNMHPASILSILADVISWAIQYDNSFNLISTYCQFQSQLEPNETAYKDLFFGIQQKINQTSEQMDMMSLTNEDPLDSMASSRSWTWITCNELGWFQTSSGFKSKWINMTYYDAVCQKLFGIGTPKLTESIGFGDQSPESSFIVYTNGLNDPWSTLGIKNTNPRNEQYQYWIEGGSHCSDLKDQTMNDSPSLISIRNSIIKQLHNWISNLDNCGEGKMIMGKCMCNQNHGGIHCEKKTVKRSHIVLLVSILMTILAVIMLV